MAQLVRMQEVFVLYADPVAMGALVAAAGMEGGLQAGCLGGGRW